MSFDIVTATYRNHEWVQPFLLSLNKTLGNRNRHICIVDSSPLNEFNELRKMNTYGLDVSFIHFTERDAMLCFLDGIRCLIQNSPDAPICIVHIDVVFLLKGWDIYIESHLQHYKMISVAPRYKTIAEPIFTVGSKSMLLEAEFKHVSVDWDNNIMLFPAHTECAYFTYLHHLRQMPYLLFDHVYELQTRWGHIMYDDIGREFAYHNFYSARCKKENDIPDIERQNAKLLIDSCESNAKTLNQLLEFDLEYSMRDELLKMTDMKFS